MQFWGVANDGHLYTTRQQLQKLEWEKWEEWKHTPKNIVELAAVLDRSGSYMTLWARTEDKILHLRSQKQFGGWGEWSVPPAPGKGWLGANPLTCMCAGLMAWDQRGKAIWGAGEDGNLWTTYETPATGWSPWYIWVKANPKDDKQPQGITALTTAVAGNGAMSLWAVDADGLLWCKSQIRYDQDWGPWVKGWWPDASRFGTRTPVDFIQICACQQGGSRGRAFWGVGENGDVYWTYEGADGWIKNWNKFPGPAKPVKSLCAVRNYGRVMLWARSQDNSLHNNTETTADYVWKGWDAGGTRPPHVASLPIIDSVTKILAKNPGYDGVTYFRSSGNTFKLLQTPAFWNQGKSPKMPSAACIDFLKEIEDTIGSAQKQLDITVLFNIESSIESTGFPDGGFQDAISSLTVSQISTPVPSRATWATR
jgi:hypothetical protein